MLPKGSLSHDEKHGTWWMCNSLSVIKIDMIKKHAFGRWIIILAFLKREGNLSSKEAVGMKEVGSYHF